MNSFTCTFILFYFLFLSCNSCTDKSTIIAEGEGTAQGFPDSAVIHIIVSNSSRTASSALDSMQNILNKVVSVLNTNNVLLSNVEVINTNLSPSKNQTLQTYEMYNSTQVISVRINNIGQPGPIQIGPLVDQLSNIEGSSLSGINFQVLNKTTLLNLARATAFKEAKSWAQLYSSMGGLRLSTIKNISEKHSVQSYGMKYNVSELMNFKSAVPGIYDITVRTTLVYNLV